MKHQLEALSRMSGRRFFALFCEQGTGKSWCILADAERLYAAGKIEALFIVAPNGVHTNWVRREIPRHLDAPVLARAWRSGAGKRAMAHIEELLCPRKLGDVPPLRVLSMNIDAVITKTGFDFARRFLLSTKCMMVIDESSRIKNPAALRTKQLMRLRELAMVARIASGTPITNAPVDAFAQMEFLESGLLGTTSYRAFVAEYAELLNANHPMMQSMIRQNPRAATAQVIARNVDGSPRWRNLDKLQGLLAPHSFRVLKRDCIDLPKKIYKQHPFELTPAQRKAYDLLQKEQRLVIDEETVAVSSLAALVKLQQVTSGFVIPPGGGEPALVDPGNNPRLAALQELVEDVDGQFIVWARFREELRQIVAALEAMDIRCVAYHGGVAASTRDWAVDSFQRGEARAFVGQPQAGGIGLTLTAAETVIYYSNDFNLETRLQSEDRAHRIGTRSNVVYIDITAEDTIDESIARSLQRKNRVAATILGDESTR